jgi:hypothetical protein
MFIKDGSTDDYAHDCRHLGIPRFKDMIYAWGWLGESVPTNNWESEELKSQVIEKIKSLGETHGVDYYCGWHNCEICAAQGKSFSKTNSFCGSIKIAHKGRVFCCPKGVEHYIEVHGYKPPDDAIDAVLNGHCYNEEEIKKIGETDPDVKQGILESKERVRKFEEKLKKEKEDQENEIKKKIGVIAKNMKEKLTTLPEFQKALNKAMMSVWRFPKDK